MKVPVAEATPHMLESPVLGAWPPEADTTLLPPPRPSVTYACHAQEREDRPMLPSMSLCLLSVLCIFIQLSCLQSPQRAAETKTNEKDSRNFGRDISCNISH